MIIYKKSFRKEVENVNNNITRLVSFDDVTEVFLLKNAPF